MNDLRHFRKDDGRELPASEDYLLPFLAPTSPGTNYWDPPPSGPMMDRQMGRVILQLHQALNMFRRCGINLAGKRLLDIGTGNGMIPRLMLEVSDLESAVGADPFLDGEHLSSWQAHDHDEALDRLREVMRERCENVLDYERYSELTSHEHFAIRPEPYPLSWSLGKDYRFAKVGAHDLDRLGERFDLFYCKAIDHIPDWDGILAAIAASAAQGAYLCIKHFSFFSFLGPHRFSTTTIPWGHLLLTDDEYRRYAQEFHPHRAETMIDFYFTGLAYPRNTMSDLLGIARRHGFLPVTVINEPLRSLSRIHRFIEDVPGFWHMVRENHPYVSEEEAVSARYHMMFRKAA